MTAVTGPYAQRQYETAATTSSTERRPTVAPAKARVRTRSIGFKLGGFGVSYTAEDVRFEEASPKPVRFSEQMETANLRQETVVSAASETLARRTLPQRRYGIQAYRDQQNPEPPMGRVLLGVV